MQRAIHAVHSEVAAFLAMLVPASADGPQDRAKPKMKPSWPAAALGVGLRCGRREIKVGKWLEEEQGSYLTTAMSAWFPLCLFFPSPSWVVLPVHCLFASYLAVHLGIPNAWA